MVTSVFTAMAVPPPPEGRSPTSRAMSLLSSRSSERMALASEAFFIVMLGNFSSKHSFACRTRSLSIFRRSALRA